MIIHARDDRLNPVAVAYRIRGGIPGAKLVIFDRAVTYCLVIMKKSPRRSPPIFGSLQLGRTH